MSALNSEAVEMLIDRKYTDVCLMVISPRAPVKAVGREIGGITLEIANSLSLNDRLVHYKTNLTSL